MEVSSIMRLTSSAEGSLRMVEVSLLVNASSGLDRSFRVLVLSEVSELVIVGVSCLRVAPGAGGRGAMATTNDCACASCDFAIHRASAMFCDMCGSSIGASPTAGQVGE